MLGSLLELATASPWIYVALLAVAAIDGVIPVVPSEASVISAGAIASSGDARIDLVVVAAALGAEAGDNVAYALGRLLGPRLERRLACGRRGAERLAWARAGLHRRTAAIVVLGRFVPGGRTATTVRVGAAGIAWPRFLRLSGIAAVIWAGYLAALGFGGGAAFEERPELGAGLGLVLGLATTLLISVAIHRRDAIGKDTDASTEGRS